MGSSVRLRQVALVATDLAATVGALQRLLDLPSAFRDPGIAEFGLDNAVFAVGDTFVEVVSPLRPGTTAGRYLERRGGDAGYMALFQVPDVGAARARVAELGVRVVWQADLVPISGTHLHPRDVPGAIVSLDEARPPDTWHWAGPTWTDDVPSDRQPGGITALTVASPDPVVLARRWGEVLGFDAAGAEVRLEDAGQVISFVEGEGEGIVAVGLTRPGADRSAVVAGVCVDVSGLDQDR